MQINCGTLTENLPLGALGLIVTAEHPDMTSGTITHDLRVQRFTICIQDDDGLCLSTALELCPLREVDLSPTCPLFFLALLHPGFLDHLCAVLIALLGEPNLAFPLE